MIDFQDFGEPVTIVRDAGYSKLLTLLPKNKLKAKKRVENPNFISGKEGIKDIFSEVGIIINPDAMTYLYRTKK